MSLPADHKALVFLGAIAVLGAGVRVSRAASHNPSPTSGTLASAGAALDRQMQAADSSARAGRSAKAKRAKKTKPKAARGASPPPAGATASQALPPLPRPKLDLDIATAAQIDSLPGISPAIAKRIAGDRLRRGPFLSLDGLRRVTGAGPALLRRIDSLVTFSGTYAFPNWNDTVIPRRTRRAPTPRPP
jgi:DNA uptake protein ComE-like DNA-binding protein